MVSEIFPWNVNFETGLAVVDEQHQKLVEIINRLAYQLANNLDDVAINQLLDELSDYTIYHFTTEEALWNKYLPADEMTAEHAQTHQSFVDEVEIVKQERHTLRDEEVSEKVLSFLTHWLAFHILDTDRRMAQIVLGIEQGMDLKHAKDHASHAMSGAMTALIETVLKMYDSLSSQTLELMRETARRQRIEHKLILSKNVIDSTFEAIFVTDPAGLLIDANPAFCTYVDSQYDQIIGQHFQSLKPQLFAQDVVSDIWQLAGEQGHWSGEIFGQGISAEREVAWLTLSAIRGEEGKVDNYAGVLSSVSQLVERQHGLELEANHDTLTGLPNRRLLNDRLEQSILHSKRTDKLLAVCFLDLDGFKAVNDTLGHDAGDEVLCVISHRLGTLVRGEDTVARIGGDEFVLLFGDLANESCLPPLLDKVLECIQRAVPIDNEQAGVSASIGVSLYPAHAEDADSLLKLADKSMYQAKQAGKSRYSIWCPDTELCD